MIEIFLVLSNFLFGVSILVYFYLKEIKAEQPDKERLGEFFAANLDNLHKVMEGFSTSLEKISISKDSLFQKTFIEYLKHNERLEKMILPQPVTKKAVQEILAQTPPIVPNDIDKSNEEVQQDELNELLAKIPITKNTKIAFEDELPEEIDGAMSGKIN